MRRRVYIVVPGIRSSTKDNLAWFVRLTEDVMRTHRSSAPAAIEFRYAVGPILRSFAQQTRARQIAALMAEWAGSGFDLILVGHSNGCDLIARAMAICNRPVEAVHMVAGACSADIKALGLANALITGRLKRLYCYVSKADTALGFWARWSQWLSPFGLDYGTLGVDGPKNVPAEAVSRVVVISRDYMEHGDWFSPLNYDSTLAAVSVAERHNP